MRSIIFESDITEKFKKRRGFLMFKNLHFSKINSPTTFSRDELYALIFKSMFRFLINLLKVVNGSILPFSIPNENIISFCVSVNTFSWRILLTSEFSFSKTTSNRENEKTSFGCFSNVFSIIMNYRKNIRKV